MDDVQEAASYSPKTWASLQFSMDSYATLPLMKEENGDGRDVIGISAVAAKAFYAITQSTNKSLDELNLKHKLKTPQSEKLRLDLLSMSYEQIENLDLTTYGYDQSILNEVKKEMLTLMNPQPIWIYDEATKKKKLIVTTFVANANLRKHPVLRVINDQICKELIYAFNSKGAETIEVINAAKVKDTSLTVSSVVSAATDNAKELVLSKINAGPALAKVHMHLISMGVSYIDIAALMVSPTVDAIVAMQKPNVFRGKNLNVIKSIELMTQGPRLKKSLGSREFDTLDYHLKTSKTSNQLLTLAKKSQEKIKKMKVDDDSPNKETIDFLKTVNLLEIKNSLAVYLFAEAGIPYTKVSQKGNMYMSDATAMVSKFLVVSGIDPQAFFQDIVPLKNGKFDSEYKKHQRGGGEFDFYEEFNYDEFMGDILGFGNDFSDNTNLDVDLNKIITLVNKINYLRKESEFNDEKAYSFQKIYEASDELSMLGTRLGINVGIKTDLYGHYSYDKRLEDYVVGLLAEEIMAGGLLSSQVEIINEMRDILGKDTQGVGDVEKLKEAVDIQFLNSLPSSSNSQERDRYRELFVKLYDTVKKKNNIIAIEQSLPHIQATILTHRTAVEQFRRTARYNYSLQAVKAMQSPEYFPMSSTLASKNFNDKEFKLIEGYIGSQLINAFFTNEESTFTLPNGQVYYDSSMDLKQSSGDTKINLKTEEGRYSFKMYFENLVFNKLKRDANLKNNKFVNGIIFDTKKHPIFGNQIFMKLNIDMLNVKTDYEKIKFQDYIEGFDSLGAHQIDGVNVKDLFMIYNLIVNNNSFGKDSFTKIFDSSVAKGDNNIVKRYLNFVGKIDSELQNGVSQTMPFENIDMDYLAVLLAQQGKESDAVDKGKYIRVYDYENKTTHIYERVLEKEKGRTKIKYQKFSDGVNGLLIVSKFKTVFAKNKEYQEQVKKNKLANSIELIFKKGNLNIEINCD